MVRFVLIGWLVLTSQAAWAGPRVVWVTDGPETVPLIEPFAAALEDVTGQAEPAAERHIVSGDWSAEGVSAALDAAYAQRPRLVMAVGLIATTMALHKGDLPVPTVAPWVIDPVFQRLPETPPRNVHPVYVQLGLLDEAEALKDVAGSEKIAILVDEAFDRVLEVPDDYPLLPVPLTQNLEASLDAIPDDVDGVMVALLPRHGPEETREVADALIARGLPSYTTVGIDGVRLGFMASHREAGDQRPVARRAALLAREILRGRHPKAGSWEVVDPGALVLNGATMAALRVAPPFDILTTAEVLDADEDTLPAEDTDAVVALTIEHSPRLAAKWAEVAAGRSDVMRSTSNWLPQADLDAVNAYVDPNLVDATFGAQARGSLQVTAEVTQLLYDDQARVLLPVERKRQLARVADYQREALDTVADVLNGYIDALRADAAVQIRSSDIQVIRANLQSARVRVSVGDATDAEVARWSSELAQARAGLVQTYVTRHIARIRVNQLIGRNVDTPFRPDPAVADNLLERFRVGPFAEWFRDQAALTQIEDALVRVGLADSPEIAQIDLGVDAQSIWHKATKRAYYMPRVGASVSGVWNAWRTTSESSIPGFEIPEQPDVYWTAGISASVPLFTGRTLDAQRVEARENLARLASERVRIGQLLELRIRSATTNVVGTYHQARLAEDAVAGALRNLEWARDAYARGLTTQVRVLDARSAALQARLAAADARYLYLAALVEAQRATAQLSFPGHVVASEALEARLRALVEEPSP